MFRNRKVLLLYENLSEDIFANELELAYNTQAVLSELVKQLTLPEIRWK